MKKAERFLVMLGLLSIILHQASPKTGAMLVLLALPALGLFYLITALPLFFPDFRFGEHKAFKIVVVVLSGIGLAYCLCCMVYYLLGITTVADMLENCSLILSLLSIVAIIAFRKTKCSVYKHILFRVLPLFVIILLLAALHRHGGSISF